MSSRTSDDGKITDEDIVRAKAQCGIPVPQRDPQWNLTVDAGAISHFAFGYGDDNPLFHDADYARSARWRGLIAPPVFPISAGINETEKHTDPAMKQLFKGLFRGVGKYYSGVRWEWYRPIYVGDELYEERMMSDIEERASRFGGGRSVMETYRMMYADRAGQVFAVRHEMYMNAERSGSREAGKYTSIERQRYTPDDIAEIDAAYEAEERRGADPRWWEDVEVGDSLTPVVKGPMTMVDIISMHMGMGWGGYGFGPLRYAWKKRTRMPGFYTPDDYGVPDVVQRLHWDEKRAQALGLPGPYDYGQMRTCWLVHLVTNWMGDDGWLWKLDNQVRGFNFHGDTHWCTGEVKAKRVEGPHAVVDLDIRATNQRGEVTTPGKATVILPSRELGPVLLPAPTLEYARRGAVMATESSARRRR